MSKVHTKPRSDLMQLVYAFGPWVLVIAFVFMHPKIYGRHMPDDVWVFVAAVALWVAGGWADGLSKAHTRGGQGYGPTPSDWFVRNLFGGIFVLATTAMMYSMGLHGVLCIFAGIAMVFGKTMFTR